jgi:eukaryotic-like serine/threonine-protein kinase
MALSVGTRLGPYEILALIGSGGMGEVYRARDPRLGRDVAIKISAERFGDRFEREARAVAALNHPNICHIYDVGPDYLVMELVEGPTLAERIKQGAVQADEALAIARQIAEALEAAHEKGIVHRDLKPANIKIRPDGTVKVLDFGLAKMAPAETSVTTENSPTLTLDAGTRVGVILGTAGYMSPEQARGKPVDKRADIWAFGVVLYEMLTGENLHKGETVSDMLASVLKEEPKWDKVPAQWRTLLRRCLEKDPKKRLRDIGDAMALVAEAQAEVPVAEAEHPSKMPWMIAAVFALAALALAALHFREKPPAAPAVTRFQIRLPEKVSFTSGGAFTLSPDGRHAAFSAIGEDKVPRVWIQDLDALEARVLRDTYTGPNAPPFFWSPDSRFVVYSENSPKLKKADAQTGALQDICDKPGPPIGGSWNQAGVIIFGSTSTGLWKVDAAGGTPVPLTKLDPSRHERQHELPSFLPDGRHFLYLRLSAMPEESGVFVGSLDDPPERQNEKQILATGFGAYFAPSNQGGPGRLLFLRDDTLMAQPFDPAKLALSGEPVPVVRGVGSVYQTGFFSASSSTLVYKTSASIRDFLLTWFDRQGKPGGTIGEPGSIAQIRISPDGNRVAYRKDSYTLAERDLWLLDISRDTSTRFTFGPSSAEFPLWSPDGSELVFSSDREGVFNLYRKPANGAREEEVLLRSNLNKRALSWSPDGKFLLYSTSASVVFSEEDMWVLPMQGDRTPYPFLQTRFDESAAKFSPDGRWVAYSSNETGRYEVYVREFVPSKDSAAAGGKWIVSKDGGTISAWREDGKELVYVDLRGRVMSMSVDSTRSFQAGAPRELFQAPAGANALAVTNDLKRFLIPVPVERKASQGFTVMLNWTSALKP